MSHTYRPLRYKEATAHISHRCDSCDQFIFPGDYYCVSISLITLSDGRRYIRSQKEHINPACDPPDEPEPPDDWAKETGEDFNLTLAA